MAHSDGLHQQSKDTPYPQQVTSGVLTICPRRVGPENQEQRDGRSRRPQRARGVKAPRDDTTSEAPVMEEGMEVKMEFGPVPGRRSPGGLFRM